MSKPNNWLFRVTAAASDSTLEIVVYDVIGKSIFGDGVGASDVLAKLGEKPKAKAIKVRVNSIGGILDEAKAMVNLLGERAAAGVDVEFRVDSLAASAAAYLLTTPGARVKVASNAFVMVHKARKFGFGTEEDFAAVAKQLRAEDEVIVQAFASASERRGKKKSKADWAAAVANNNDRYFSAAEAVEWGIADDAGAASDIAACTIDVAALKDAPDELLRAPYAVATPPAAEQPPAAAPEQAAAQAQLPFPPASSGAGPIGNEPRPAQGDPQNEETMNVSKKITQALALAEDAGEDAVAAAIARLQTQARAGGEIEKLLGVTGAEAVGAVRALKESQAANASLAVEVGKLKITNARRDFESARAEGLKERKLTPATAKLYTDRFENAVKPDENGESASDGSDVVADLKGFLSVAPRLAISLQQPSPEGSSGGAAATQHNGKAFEDMKPADRHLLKKQNPELYNTMREDAVSRGAL